MSPLRRLLGRKFDLMQLSTPGSAFRISATEGFPAKDQREPNGCNVVRFVRPKTDSTVSPSGKDKAPLGTCSPRHRKSDADDFHPRKMVSLVNCSVCQVSFRPAATASRNQISRDDGSLSSSTKEPGRADSSTIVTCFVLGDCSGTGVVAAAA